MNIVIGGIQGSGKGTQSKILASKFEMLRHIPVGDCIANYLNADPDYVLPYTLEKYKNGELAPTEVVNKVVAREIEGGNFILDGFPRKKGQLDFLMQQTTKVDLFIWLVLDEKECVKRLLSRARADDKLDSINKRLDQFKEITLRVFLELEMLVPTYRVAAGHSPDYVASIIESIVKLELSR